MGTVWLVSDPELSPLDLAIAPNGNLVVSSEHPFGASGAAMTVREYDAAEGHLVRVFSPSAELRRPRGLRFGPDGHLYCVAQDEVVAFDTMSGDRSAISPTARPSAGVLSLNANNGSRSLWTKAPYSERE